MRGVEGGEIMVEMACMRESNSIKKKKRLVMLETPSLVSRSYNVKKKTKILVFVPYTGFRFPILFKKI